MERDRGRVKKKRQGGDHGAGRAECWWNGTYPVAAACFAASTSDAIARTGWSLEGLVGAGGWCKNGIDRAFLRPSKLLLANRVRNWAIKGIHIKPNWALATISCDFYPCGDGDKRKRGDDDVVSMFLHNLHHDRDRDHQSNHLNTYMTNV